MYPTSIIPVISIITAGALASRSETSKEEKEEHSSPEKLYLLVFIDNRSENNQIQITQILVKTDFSKNEMYRIVKKNNRRNKKEMGQRWKISRGKPLQYSFKRTRKRA